MYEIAGKKIASTLAEIVDPAHTALLIWDMEYAIAPNAFNYKDLLPKLQELSALARRAGVRVFYSVQTGFDLAKEEAGVWVRIRMKRAKVSDPKQLLSEKEDPHDREIVAELTPEPQDIVFHKRRPDGFIGTDLDLMLRSNGIKTHPHRRCRHRRRRRGHGAQRAKSWLRRGGLERLCRLAQPRIA